jgi:PhnB protein
MAPGPGPLPAEGGRPVRDPLGNIWWVQAHVEDVDPAGMARRPQDPAAAEALRYVETSLDTAMRDSGR